MTLPVYGNPLSLNEIKGEFGGSNPIGLSGYYAGGGLVPPGTVGYPSGGNAVAIPSSGTISIANFFGSSNTGGSGFDEYAYFFNDGTFVIPPGTTDFYYWIVGGGGRGGSATLNLPATGEAQGGGGGGGEVKYGYKSSSDLIPGTTSLSIIVGAGGYKTINPLTSNGGSSSITGFNGGSITASGGTGGGDATASNTVVNGAGGTSGNGNLGYYAGGGYVSAALDVQFGFGQCFGINGEVWTFGRGGDIGGGNNSYPPAPTGSGQGGRGKIRAGTQGGSEGQEGGSGIVIIRYKRPSIVSYTTPGTYSYTVPPGIYSLNMLITAGGGAGGIANSTGPISPGVVVAASGGGGGGGTSYQKYDVTPGQVLTLIVGSGGSANPVTAATVSSVSGGLTGTITSSAGNSGGNATGTTASGEVLYGTGGTSGNGKIGNANPPGPGPRAGDGGGSCNSVRDDNTGGNGIIVLEDLVVYESGKGGQGGSTGSSTSGPAPGGGGKGTLAVSGGGSSPGFAGQDGAIIFSATPFPAIVSRFDSMGGDASSSDKPTGVSFRPNTSGQFTFGALFGGWISNAFTTPTWCVSASQAALISSTTYCRVKFTIDVCTVINGANASFFGPGVTTWNDGDPVGIQYTSSWVTIATAAAYTLGYRLTADGVSTGQQSYIEASIIFEISLDQVTVVATGNVSMSCASGQ